MITHLAGEVHIQLGQTLGRTLQPSSPNAAIHLDAQMHCYTGRSRTRNMLLVIIELVIIELVIIELVIIELVIIELVIIELVIIELVIIELIAGITGNITLHVMCVCFHTRPGCYPTGPAWSLRRSTWLRCAGRCTHPPGSGRTA